MMVKETLPEKWFGRFWPSRSPTVREGLKIEILAETRALANARASAWDTVTQPIDTFRARPVKDILSSRLETKHFTQT
jgi:hypothetical protein